MLRPNILIYTSHDTGRHISPYGVKTVRTPNAERFASQGVLLEQAFCTMPQCSPSRASLFTGRYPHATGVLGIIDHRLPEGWDLNADEVHAAHWLGELGYDTAAIGVTHETRDASRVGYHDVLEERDALRVGGALDLWLGQRGTTERPFFASIGTRQTHRPFDAYGCAADEQLGVTVPGFLRNTADTRSDFAAFQGSIAQWDQGLGDLLGVLDRRGLADDTLVIVTTDHGMAFPRAKCTLYDPGLEVLLMLRWPGRLPASRRFGGIVSNVDVLPTLAKALGEPGLDRWHGRSFWGAISNPSIDTHREHLFAEKPQSDAMRCARSAGHKLIRNFHGGPGVQAPVDVMASPAYRDNIDAVLTPRTHPPVELYDLNADPLEQHNLADDASHAPVRDQLDASLARWMRDTDDPLLGGPIANSLYTHSRAAIERWINSASA